jgi:hypothetical protein
MDGLILLDGITGTEAPGEALNCGLIQVSGSMSNEG